MTYLLEHAEREGVFIANRPQSLRDANEKLFTTLFPEWMPTTLVSASQSELRDFLKQHHDIVCKPLNSMGGTSVFRVKHDDVNANVIFETLTSGGQTYIMAQVYLPSIREGDKRILMINGKPIPHALARVPQSGDWRGNLAVGAQPRVQPLSARDREITEAIGPHLRERGLYFVGLDVIGDSLTEINVTSPTGIREIEAATGFNAAAVFLDSLAQLRT
jgi:glutathione synthase